MTDAFTTTYTRVRDDLLRGKAVLHIRPQTLRAALCRDGHYFGIRPVKLPNRMLAWPADAIDRLLNGEAI